MSNGRTQGNGPTKVESHAKPSIVAASQVNGAKSVTDQPIGRDRHTHLMKAGNNMEAGLLGGKHRWPPAKGATLLCPLPRAFLISAWCTAKVRHGVRESSVKEGFFREDGQSCKNEFRSIPTDIWFLNYKCLLEISWGLNIVCIGLFLSCFVKPEWGPERRSSKSGVLRLPSGPGLWLCGGWHDITASAPEGTRGQRTTSNQSVASVTSYKNTNSVIVTFVFLQDWLITSSLEPLRDGLEDCVPDGTKNILEQEHNKKHTIETEVGKTSDGCFQK